MAIPINPTAPVTGKQAEDYLNRMDRNEIQPTQKVNLNVSKETNLAVKQFIKDQKAKNSK